MHTHTHADIQCQTLTTNDIHGIIVGGRKCVYTYRYTGRTKVMNEIMTATAGSITAAAEVTPDLFERWTHFIDASPRTVETYTKSVKQFFLYLQDNGITRPQREDIIAYRTYLLQDHKPTTVQIYTESVKLFFQWLEQEGLYKNVALHVKGAKVDREHKKDALTTKQVQKLLTSIDRTCAAGKRDYAILSLMVTTGLRTVSIVEANVEDLRTADDHTVLFYLSKGHEEKSVYVKIAEPVEDAIRDYLKTRGKLDPKAPLFASAAHRNSGERMTTRSISRIVKERLADIGIDSDRLTAHSLRHSAATLNLRNGGTLEETQQLLGHKNVATTMIYIDELERSKNTSEERIAGVIFG